MMAMYMGQHVFDFTEMPATAEIPDVDPQLLQDPVVWTMIGPMMDKQVEAFNRVIETFPELRIVMAHMGGGSWRRILEFSKDHPHAYYDISEIIEWTGASRAPTDLDLAKLILKVGIEKVMMGSDFPWYSILRTVKRIHELPLLNNEQKDLILGGNALELLS